MAGRKKREFKFRASIANEPMLAAEWDAAERLLARLIARAYAADHPELFHRIPTDAARSAEDGPADTDN
jgi:hypothetical protein